MSRKTRFALYIDGDILKEAERRSQEAGYKSVSRYIEEAVHARNMGNAVQTADEYMAPLLTKVMETVMKELAQRIGRLLYKIAVELCMCEHLLALDTDETQDTMKRLRARCEADLKRTEGKISFEDILRFQKREDLLPEPENVSVDLSE